MKHVDHLVVGAGPTGVGAACRLQELGHDYLLVESENRPGGMARSITDDNGFTWDLGGHVLHSHFASFDVAIADADVEMTYPARNGWILLNGALVPTPIQHQLAELPDDLAPDAVANNLGEYYHNQFGKTLAEEFFIPFQEKMWATPVDRVAHDWTSLRNGSAERNVPHLKLAMLAERDSASASARRIFPYPKGGTGQLWSAICDKLDQSRIRYNTTVTSIDPQAKLAAISTGELVSYENLISTVPLPTLLNLMGNRQFSAIDNLVANSVFVVGLGFEGAPPDALADKSWLYNPDTEVAWHRATMLSNYDQSLAGEGRWNILFEVGRSNYRRVPDETAIEACLASVASLGADLSMLRSTFRLTVAAGYPVPTLGRDEILSKIDSYLCAMQIRSRGRFGGWRYESCNQDYSFQQGREAVDAAMFGTPELCYWHPEYFS
jgi:protoporphyrinogen oxidase